MALPVTVLAQRWTNIGWQRQNNSSSKRFTVSGVAASAASSIRNVQDTLSMAYMNLLLS